LFAAFSLAASGGPRIGITTPRALGNAVVRNRIRRRVREAVRLELELLSPEWFIVFNPRKKAQDCLFSDLQAEVRRFFAARRAKSPSGSSAGTNG
jgi:ribonuclease P protein component